MALCLLAEMMPELTPPQLSSPDSRPYSILGQRVHHHRQPRRLGPRGGRVVAHAELHPHHLDALLRGHCDGLVGGPAGGLGAAKYVDHRNPIGDLGEARIHRLAEDFAASLRRVDRDDAIPLRLEILHGKVAGPHPVCAGADHGDGSAAAQNTAEQRIRVVVVVHGASAGTARRGPLIRAARRACACR